MDRDKESERRELFFVRERFAAAAAAGAAALATVGFVDVRRAPLEPVGFRTEGRIAGRGCTFKGSTNGQANPHTRN